MTDKQTFRIARVGAEPVVFWDRDEENDLPRATILMPGWKFTGPGGAMLEMGEGAMIRFTAVTDIDGEPLVPSDPDPDIENGFIKFGLHDQFGESNGDYYTLAQLRDVARLHGKVRRWLRWRRGR